MSKKPQATYLVGDIHGCYQEWLSLEEKIYKQAAHRGQSPLIVSVGDLIDRGPDSAKVVAHFGAGVRAGTHAVVMGNHELMMLECLWEWAPWNFDSTGWPAWLNNYRKTWEAKEGFSRWLPWEDYRVFARSLWLSQGGYQTLSSYGCDPHQPGTWLIPPETLQFLLHLPYVWENEEVIVTHALARPQDLKLIQELGPLRDKHAGAAQAFLQHSHSLIWNRTPPRVSPDSKNRLHVSGHTPVSRLKRWKQAQCLQIDTACVYGSRLSTWCVESQERLSVKAARNYLHP
ncbi:hypothetical protein COW36_23040 [bacterium (Candidatus Blackallbacteria) CG17_big_fil_post_rev_8_21_14_2_50_48_46]|uniref:Calcineurin-like phosphoesterase domain-containing protein n=1 Tax=bacterium (Candidatus Blackallbacteria) CG17_big_fil_post_rev_8_21_14_2_50_48_46 TaxID=2014261 RepID=A0A2M7FXX9_9BACT|nr:MAG: hypothetical protein COW64_16110 [bacterium (Candidatus Blackallbacteria) CG18_big_fil_WC_8_21_14_2_50_49_26]PIW14127.1 MAG: hypothetical protein COW36_23040 [bacterium (Candidatus Blackallbacteria) CG17_big_fil_post_rev_8_21_14_2_50_48_46]PIW45857.1 MAG: hypothetical protein COW20_18705 [bacterium (Candidatus Blackallbacteria) CG13_big_fil_rev_8_21_14_2_50_49_14]